MSVTSATITLSAEVANARTASIQIGTKGTRGATAHNIGSKRAIGAYVSSDASGLVPIDLGGDDVIPSDGGAGAILTALDAADEQISEIRLVTNAAGLVQITLTNASDEAKTRYLNVILPDGRVEAPVAIAFADNTP